MSSHCCPICFFPVYLIIPGYVSGRDSGHVWEYTCLYSACNNFKVSLSQSGIIVNSDPQVGNASVDYPSWPLEQELPALTSSQTWFAQPHPQQSMQPGLIDTAIDVSRQVSGESDYLSWPLPEELLAPTASQTQVHQPFSGQNTQQEYVAVTQAIPGTAPTAKRVKAREPGCKKTPAKKGGRMEGGPPTLKKPLRNKRYRRGGDLPTLEKPLSELLDSDVSDLMTEVTNYVNRSVERRHREAEVDGKVKRPLNAFILYRMACKDATMLKQCLFDQQKISRILGQSWAMESERVRDQFNELAANERTLHKQAFPDYIFEPRGPQRQPTRRRARVAA